MAQIFPIDFDEKLTMAQDDYILFSDSEDGNKIKKAQYKNLKGEKGDPGTPGTPGKDGEDGAAATVTVGSVSTLPAGSSATVTNSGTSSAAVLNFGIPEGATGAAGADGKDGTDGKDGKDGTDGAAATITVGTTTTLPAGSSATVTNVGTSSAAIFNFGIPKGDSGTGSGDVNGPASSTDGDVAIFDGSTGKLIKDGSVALSTLSSGASLAATAIQPGDNVSDLNNDSGFITGIDSGDVTTALGYTPYNASNPDGYTTNTGDVVGPASSTDGHLALFDGATGKLIKDGGAVPTGVPTVGTDGQVLTVVSGSAAWAAPSGGDVLVSDQANNIFTPGMKIWGGTKSDFDDLVEDSNTAYLILADQPSPPSPSYTITGSTTVGSFTPGSFSDLQGFYISPDGENAYITFWNSGSGRMAQYSLSTPWDISTASQTQYISVTKPNGFYFSNDGTYMFLSTEDGNNIVRYSLSTAWDISTASLDSGQVLNVNSSRFADNVCLSDDGDYIWFGVDSLYKIVQYELTTPFDLTTATNKKELSVAESGIGVMVKNDGKYMYIAPNTGVIKQYELATAYDITSTATEIGSYSVSAPEPRTLFVSNDCKYWAIGNNSGGITQFEAQPIS